MNHGRPKATDQMTAAWDADGEGEQSGEWLQAKTAGDSEAPGVSGWTDQVTGEKTWSKV